MIKTLHTSVVFFHTQKLKNTVQMIKRNNSCVNADENENENEIIPLCLNVICQQSS